MPIVPVVTVADLLAPIMVPNLLHKQFERMTDDPVLAKQAVAEFNDGDFFIVIGGGIVIYGEVNKDRPVRPDEETLFGMDDDQREELIAEFIGELEMFNALEESGYLFGNCYSVMCPEGELGSTHVHLITAKIDRKTFERAKSNGWRHITPVN